MNEIDADWPDDADGGVFRRLAEHDFDFSKQHTVDYNVDFPRWPPPFEAVEKLKATYGPVELYDPEDGDLGHVLFRVHSLVSYEGVTSIQRQASLAMSQFGGVCESWGVLQDAP